MVVISFLTQIYLSLVLLIGLMKKAILIFAVVLAAAAVLGGLASVPSTVQNANANPCSGIRVGGVSGGEVGEIPLPGSSNNNVDTGDVNIKCDLEHVDIQ